MHNIFAYLASITYLLYAGCCAACTPDPSEPGLGGKPQDGGGEWGQSGLKLPSEVET